MKRLLDKNLYYVGGIVRDSFLGIKSLDTDLCFQGNAIDFATENFKQYIVKINQSFGTVKIIINGNEVDIASTREESYPRPGHLPVIHNIGCILERDLFRRDFTINAMAKNTLTGDLYDPFDGKTDIKSKLIRVLHKNSFIDDPTRIIRALKFSGRFGFDIEPETKQLQEEYLSNINYDMSYHRLKKELIETFNINSGEIFNTFVKNKIYKLLGDNQTEPDIDGIIIQNAINTADYTPWIIYLSFFNLKNLPLTKRERNIIEWISKLKTEKSTNNTPKESILIHNILKEYKC